MKFGRRPREDPYFEYGYEGYEYEHPHNRPARHEGYPPYREGRHGPPPVNRSPEYDYEGYDQEQYDYEPPQRRSAPPFPEPEGAYGEEEYYDEEYYTPRPRRQQQSEGKGGLIGSIVVLVLGCFCCPIWLLGALFLKKEGTPKFLGIASLVLAVLTFIIAGSIIAAVLLAKDDECKDMKGDECFTDTKCGICNNTQKCSEVAECDGPWYDSHDRYCAQYSSSGNLFCNSLDLCTYCVAFASCYRTNRPC